MDVYVFPANGQDAQEQLQDKVACYNWATSNTGSDPFQLTRLSAAQAQAKQQGTSQQQATKAQIGNFKKAFSVCLEVKE